MPNRVNAYINNRTKRRLHGRQPVIKSITYISPYGDDGYLWQGQRFEDYDSASVAIAKAVLHADEANPLPDDEINLPYLA